MAAYVTDDDKWNALLHRDRRADGHFWYGVLTTGIYCRPGCASRRPNRENVRFFNSPDAAEQAGYRPCLRCRPRLTAQGDPRLRMIVTACRTIAAAENPPQLKELALQAGLSPFHFQRLFKKYVGVTPKQFAMEHRIAAARHRLQKKRTVTEAIYHAGFSSSSRFYEQAETALGMTPMDFKNGAPNISIHYTTLQTDLGWVLVAATSKGICSVLLGDTPGPLEQQLREHFPKALIQGADPGFATITATVVALIESPHLDAANLPMDIQGTAFQRRVWLALQQIKPGSTTSYAELARSIGHPSAARAVAQACARNPLAVVIPCHRVVRSDGGIGGYRWGVDRKRRLLDQERQKNIPLVVKGGARK